MNSARIYQMRKSTLYEKHLGYNRSKFNYIRLYEIHQKKRCMRLLEINDDLLHRNATIRDKIRQLKT